MFSARHCEALADSLRQTKPPFLGQTGQETEIALAQWQRCVASVADTLSATMGFDNNGNRSFKRNRFLKACKADV